MISISGIKYQKELETLPYFTKPAASLLFGKKGKNLDKKISQLTKKGYLIVLKKGLYTTTSYCERTDKESYIEYIANILRSPSYISLEYVLWKEGLIPEAVYAVTSISLKSPRNFTNTLGNFYYRNIKRELFAGYRQKEWQDKNIYIASPAKALFDFLYLKKLPHPMDDIINLRINWDNFGKEDMSEFRGYITSSGSQKMLAVYKIIKSLYHVS